MNESEKYEPSAVAADNSSRTNGAWRLPLLLAVVLVAIVAARSSQTHERTPATPVAPAPLTADATGKVVSLAIQFDAGREREFDAIDWHPGMTVDDLMTAASRLPNGITYTVTGDHEMTLLGSIDGVINERRGDRFWTYRVNGVPADRSLAVYELQPGDRVLWTFGRQE
jgi:hypothetical protein